MRNYYLAHKKEFLGFYKVVDNLGFLEQILRFQTLFYSI